jgi:methionyl aminopeptidase
LAETLNFLTNEYIKPGLTTLDLSRTTEEFIRSHDGATPAFLGYGGFPGALCVSVNEQVVHGVPGDLVIKEGDIVSVDCGVLLEGHYTDAARTVGVGKISPQTTRLLDITRESLDMGIEQAVVGNNIGDISFAVQRHVERNGFNVSLEFVGHGIGKVLHGPPCVPNYGLPGRGPLIESGACLAIEPVVFDGDIGVVLAEDQWTVSSVKRNMSAHFEDTIVITEEGPEIVTR